MTELNKKAFGGLARFLIGLAVLLFLPAWTLRFWQAWVFLGVFSACVLAITVYLMKKDPQLLEKRLNAGSAAEKEKSQKIIQGIASIAFITVIVFPPIDHRFGWSLVPWYVALAGDVLVVVGLWIIFLVFKENSFASATIEIAADQRVISTGPYAVVRHPMYMGALIMLLGVPLALGSWWGLLTIIPFTFVLAWRLLDEESFLAKALPGYLEYRRIVKYRLVPFIW